MKVFDLASSFEFVMGGGAHDIPVWSSYMFIILFILSIINIIKKIQSTFWFALKHFTILSFVLKLRNLAS